MPQNVGVLQYIADRWNRIIDTWLYNPANPRYPQFSEFCKFVTDEAQIASGPGTLALNRPDTKSSSAVNQQRNITDERKITDALVVYALTIFVMNVKEMDQLFSTSTHHQFNKHEQIFFQKRMQYLTK